MSFLRNSIPWPSQTPLAEITGDAFKVRSHCPGCFFSTNTNHGLLKMLFSKLFFAGSSGTGCPLRPSFCSSEGGLQNTSTWPRCSPQMAAWLLFCLAGRILVQGFFGDVAVLIPFFLFFFFFGCAENDLVDIPTPPVSELWSARTLFLGGF